MISQGILDTLLRPASGSITALAPVDCEGSLVCDSGWLNITYLKLLRPPVFKYLQLWCKCNHLGVNPSVLTDTGAQAEAWKVQAPPKEEELLLSSKPEVLKTQKQQQTSAGLNCDQSFTFQEMVKYSFVRCCLCFTVKGGARAQISVPLVTSSSSSWLTWLW